MEFKKDFSSARKVSWQHSPTIAKALLDELPRSRRLDTASSLNALFTLFKGSATLHHDLLNKTSESNS